MSDREVAVAVAGRRRSDDHSVVQCSNRNLVNYYNLRIKFCFKFIA